MQEHGLRKQPIGWVKVAGLGVAIVIAGQFVGWNYGLQAGGIGGMLVAAVLMLLLYLGLAQSLAELSSAVPSAGGFYTYARLAFGNFTGFLTGLSVLIALIFASGIAPEFIVAYSESVIGVGGWPVKLALVAIVVGIHMRGVGEALGVTLAVGAAALCILLLFMLAMAPHFEPSKLVNLSEGAPGSLFPFGIAGIVACVPFAVWLFLGLEHAALASEEVVEPDKVMPRGLIGAVAILASTAGGVVLFAAGGGGAEQIKAAGDPLYVAITSPLAYGRDIWLAKLVGVGALLALFAAFFSIVYSASRQLYALSRGGYAPHVFSRTNGRGAPFAALIAVGALGFPISFLEPDQVLVLVVLLLNISYLILLASFMRLRVTQPELPRPYRSRGGVPLAVASAALSVLVIWSCFQVQGIMLVFTCCFYAAFLLHFALARRGRGGEGAAHVSREGEPS